MNTSERLLTLEQAARQAAMSPTNFRRLVREGKVPSHRFGERIIRVDWGAVKQATKFRAKGK